MNFRKITAFLLAALLAFSLSSCTLIVGKFKTEIKDSNGEEDSSLAVLTGGDVCADNFETYCVIYGFAPSGEKSYSGEEQWHDADKTEAEALTAFSGVALLQATYGKEDKVKFTVTCARSAGNLRIVLIDEQGKIIHDFATEGTSELELTGALGKEYEIRVAGESAKFNVTVERTFG